MTLLRSLVRCVLKKSNQFHHDCLPILLLLYIMLYIMPAYLMLFSALSNAVCLYKAFFLLLTFLNAFLFSYFVLSY